MVSKFKKPIGAEGFIKAANIDVHSDSDISINNSTASNINIGIDTSIYHWQKYNKKSVRKKVFNLKINEYYLEAIRYLANPEEGISMQNIVQEILIKELDKRIKEIESK